MENHKNIENTELRGIFLVNPALLLQFFINFAYWIIRPFSMLVKNEDREIHIKCRFGVCRSFFKVRSVGM